MECAGTFVRRESPPPGLSVASVQLSGCPTGVLSELATQQEKLSAELTRSLELPPSKPVSSSASSTPPLPLDTKTTGTSQPSTPNLKSKTQTPAKERVKERERRTEEKASSRIVRGVLQSFFKDLRASFAEPNSLEERFCAIVEAMQHGREGDVERLVSFRRSDVNIANPDGQTPLFFADTVGVWAARLSINYDVLIYSTELYNKSVLELYNRICFTSRCWSSCAP